MGVSGENYWPESASWGYSYYFSNYAICWGLATWKRAWNLLDWELKSWPEARSRNVCYDFFNSGFEQEYWLDVFEGIYTGAYPGSYDYKWLYTCLMQNGLTIHPVVNLISNIGYGQEATHTRFRGPLAERATGSLCIERHPPFVFPLRQANQAIFDWRFPGLDMKKSRTLSFRVTQPARKLKHWLTMKGVFGKSKSG